jgi:hypothetical protein
VGNGDSRIEIIPDYGLEIAKSSFSGLKNDRFLLFISVLGTGIS